MKKKCNDKYLDCRIKGIAIYKFNGKGKQYAYCLKHKMNCNIGGK